MLWDNEDNTDININHITTTTTTITALITNNSTTTLADLIDNLIFNSSTPKNDNEDEESTTSASQNILVAAAVLLALVIIFFNILTIIVLHRTPSLQTISNMYISSLAVVDLMVGITLLPIASYLVAHVRIHFFQKFGWACVLMNSLTMGSIAMSIIHLMFISIDRCIYIKMPFVYSMHMTAKRTRILIVCIWVFGVLYIVLPPLILPKGQQESCRTIDQIPLWYVVYCNTSIYFIAAGVALIMYIVILHTATKQHKRSKVKVLPVASCDRSITAGTANNAVKTPRFPALFKNKITDKGGTGIVELNSISQTVVYQYPPSTAATTLPYETANNQAQINNISFKNDNNPVQFDDTTDFNNDNRQRVLNVNSEESSASVSKRDNFSITQDPQLIEMKPSTHKPISFPPASTSMPKQTAGSMKTIKFFATVYGVFIISITPAIICYVLGYYMHVDSSLYNCSALLAATNSGANFIIFLTLNSTFRNAVRNTIKGWCSFGRQW